MADNNIENKTSDVNFSFMDDVQYFKERLNSQLDFFDDKASQNKEKYKFYKRLEFILAASIPVVIGLSAMGIAEGSILFHIRGVIGMEAVKIPFTLSIALQILAALSGVFLAFINKIIELDEYYKNWKEFRLTHELLYNQKILYLTKSEPYTGKDAFKILVSNVEGILAKEIQKWSVQRVDDNKLTQNALSSLEKMFNKNSDSSSGVTSVGGITTTETTVDETTTAVVTDVKTETKTETVTDEKKGTEIEVKTETKENDEEIVG